MEQRPAEESGADQEDDRERHLQHHQGRSHPLVSQRVAAGGARLERVVALGRESERAAQQSAGQAGEQREHRGEGNHPGVGPVGGDDRAGARTEREGTGEHRHAEQHRCSRGDRGQHRRLHEELTTQLPARGPEGGADGQLAPAPDGPGQKEVRHVHAGDEEHASGRAQEQERQLVGSSEDGGTERHHVGGVRRRAGMGLDDPIERPTDLGPGLGERRPRSEAADGADDVRALVLHVDLGERRHPERQDDVGGRLGEREVGRGCGDSHHLVDVAIERERAAQHRRRATERAAPEPVADHRDASRRGTDLGGRELAAHLQREPQCPEQPRAREEHVDLPGLAGPGPAERLAPVHGDRGEVGRAPGNLLGVGDAERARELIGARPWTEPDGHQPLRVSERQGAQLERLDDAEQRGVAADAEGERQHDGQAHRRGRRQLSERRAQISRNTVHGRASEREPCHGRPLETPERNVRIRDRTFQSRPCPCDRNPGATSPPSPGSGPGGVLFACPGGGMFRGGRGSTRAWCILLATALAVISTASATRPRNAVSPSPSRRE